MTQMPAHTEDGSTRSVTLDIFDISKKQLEAIVGTQKEMFEALQELHRDCVARASSEANLASDLSAKLMAARSISATSDAYREWLSRRMEMLAEDNRRLLEGSKKFMEASGRLLSNGWVGSGI